MKNDSQIIKFLALLHIVVYIVLIIGIWGRPETERLRNLSDIFPEADFLCFWGASSLALNGRPADVYDPRVLKTVEEPIMGANASRPWIYPPSFLLIVLPLALIPFYHSLIIWALATLAGYLWIIRRLVPHHLAILITLAYPATLQNFVRGQNGFLSTFLLGGGLLLLDGHPFLGGFILGLLCYKPQIFLLIFLALLAGRCWKALLAATLSAMGLLLASILAFGYEIWTIFWHMMLVTQKVMQSQAFDLGPVCPTLFGAARLVGLDFWHAMALQGLLSILVSATVIWVWSRIAPQALRNSVLIVAIALSNPYFLIYDLTILAIPLALLGWHLYINGSNLWERIILILNWSMAAFIVPISIITNIQAGPVFMLLFLLVILSKYVRDESPEFISS